MTPSQSCLAEVSLSASDLRAVWMLAQTGHFGKAAEALGISQPALTKRIRSIEKRLGGPLFERGARVVAREGGELVGRIRPTLAGETLSTRAEGILADTWKAESAVRATLAGLSGRLRIGVGLSAMLLGLPEVLLEFRRRHPGIEMQVRDMSTSGQIAALRSDELDVGFIRMSKEGGDSTGLHVEPVFRDRLRVVVPEANAQAWRDQPLVTIAEAVSPTYRAHVRKVCRGLRYDPPSIQEANQLLMVLMLVQSGLGVSLVPESVRALGYPGIRMLEDRDGGLTRREAEWQIGMAWDPRSSAEARNPGILRFAKIVRKMVGLSRR